VKGYEMGIEEAVTTIDKGSVKEAIAKARYTPQSFATAYSELCKEYGYQIAFVPQWKQSMDTGTFSLVIQTAVAETPKENK
jgi:hypothetical protein